MRNLRYILCLILVSFWGAAGEAEVIISTTSQPVTIDGILNEDAWAETSVQQLKYQIKPANNAISHIDTEVMLSKNEEELYIAFRAYDPDPSKIRAFLRNRDQGFDDDRVEFSIDTFDNGQSAYRFSVNAVGVQIDGIRNEINNEDTLQWDVKWESATRITEFGYVVEMAIPYAALSFPTSDFQRWRINLQRYYPREQQYRFSLNPDDRNNSCEICQYALTSTMTRVNHSTNLTLTPSFVYHRSKLIRYGDVPDLDLNGNDIGMDLRWGVSSSTSVSATFNPDFSQVESDTATLDVNQKFSTKKDENRHFFIKGAEYFQTNIDLVHSRTIVDPDYGFKLTTKTDNQLFSALVAQDAQTNIILPGSQGSDIERIGENAAQAENLSAVVRYLHQIGNGLTIGSLLTHRQARDVDYKNTLVSIDSRWQISDSNKLYFQIMGSNTEYPVDFQLEYQQPSHLSDNGYFAQYEHDTETWYHSFSYQNIGKNFRADSGFVTQTNIENFSTNAGYQWYGEEDQWWSKLDWEIDWDLTYDQNGQLLERKFETDIETEGLWQSTLEVGAEVAEEVFNFINYSTVAYKLGANIKPLSGIDVTAKFESGEKIDTDNERLANFFEYKLAAELNFGQHLLLNITQQYESLKIAPGTVYDAYSQDVRLSYQFTTNSSLALTYIVEATDKNLLLYNDPVGEAASEKQTSFKLVYSYKPSPQTLFIAGYQQGRERENNVIPKQTDQRTAFAKVSYAWDYH